jgi:diguanylate cyclase (GGDEF)-like protein
LSGPTSHRGERRRQPPFPPAPRRAESVAPPRLVLRFAIYTAVGLALAAAGILLFVRQHGIAQAENSVAFHARFIADSALRDELRATDFSKPVTGRRRAALDGLFRSEILVGGTLGATLYGPDGQVTYSTDHARIARARPSAGKAVQTSVEKWGDKKALSVFVPVRLGDGSRTTGMFALHQDYAPIAAAARNTFVPVAGVLEVALLGLYLSLFPLLRRVSRRLQGHFTEIEHQALHDGLTGLPNRDLLRRRVDEALAEARERRTGVSVLLLDLDRFKEINDTLGHQSGDLLLQRLGDRLSSLIRDTDTVARLGGDEFAVVSPGASDAEGALALAERIRAGLDEPFALAGLTVQVEASIGIALFPEHGEDVEALIRHADVAMYNAKKHHRTTLYSQKDDHYSPDRLALVGELRRAIAGGELVVHYQPRVELASGEVRTVEALVRWDHPDRGLLSPGEFLPLAEHTGLIRPLTRYVLDLALAGCSGWVAEGLRPGVSMNLSARDLLDAELPFEVEGLLEKHGVDPTLLEMEITENTILTDPERARTVLERLRALGVRLSIDDFGTGFSSLGQLRRLPVDVLKIDKSFVFNMDNDDNDDVIVRSTIELGHNLGLRVVAEGVETQETWNRLAQLGCDTAQGFFISRPLPRVVLMEWLRKRTLEDPPRRMRLVG